MYIIQEQMPQPMSLLTTTATPLIQQITHLHTLTKPNPLTTLKKKAITTIIASSIQQAKPTPMKMAPTT